MRKRTIISVFLTILAIFFTNSYWLISKDGHHSFEFDIFVIITILSFLLFYKIADYIADFKTIKGKSRLDIIFLTIFFAFLFVPLSHIDKSDISKQENRTLKKWKPLILNKNEINYNFGKDFEKWFNDRFNLRLTFMKCHNFILYKIVHNKKILKNYYYKNGYMFQDRTFVTYNDNDIKIMSENIGKIKSFLNSKKIDLYVLIIPAHDVFNHNYFPILNKKPQTNIDKAVNEIRNNTGTDIYYLEDYLRSIQTSEPVYFKTDGHLTDTTSYYLYKFIFSKLSKKYKNLKLTDEKEFNISKNKLVRHRADRKFFNGILYDELLIKDKKLLKTKYTYFDYKNEQNIKTDETEKNTYHYENPDGYYNIMVIGDSFTVNICHILKTSLREIWQYNDNNNFYKEGFQRYYNAIDKNKPDAIIFMYNSNNFDRLKYLLNNEE